MMTRYFKYKPYLLLPIMLMTLLVTACSSIDCELNSKVMCKVQLQDLDGNNVQFTTPASVVLVHAGGDTTIYINAQAQLSEFDIPLSYQGNDDVIRLEVSKSDTLKIISDGVAKDTIVTTSLYDDITINKTNEPWFESVDCAAHYNHTINTAEALSHNFIDHVVINEPYVSNNAIKKNLYIRIRHY